MAEKAWLAIWTDISRETEYTVYLNESTADATVGEATAALAQRELETIEWDEEDADRLKAIVQAGAEKRWVDVMNDWDEWRSDMGPLDDDVELVEIDLFT